MNRITRMTAECAVLAGLLICASPIPAASPAEAQTVQQSGSVTQNHIATWATNGIIKDGGAVAANQSLMGGSATTTAAGNTVYCASAGCGASVATASQVPFTGTLSNLSASVATAPGTGHSIVVTVYTGVYGSATASALTCTIANTATSCTDTAHQVNLPLGTSWTIQFAVGASATSTGGQAGGVQFTSSSPPTPTTPFVLQSGQITSGHQAVWTTNGVIQDGGVPVNSAIAPGPFTAGDFVYVNNLLQLADSGISIGTLSIANNQVLGNVSGVPATVVGLTPTQLTTLCTSFTSSLSGCVPASGGGTVNFLRADGTWSLPPPISISNTNATGASRTFSNADCGVLVRRSNSGTVMTDSLPGSTPLTANCVVYVENIDTTAFYGVQAIGSAVLCNPLGAIAGSPASGCVTNGYLLLGPGQGASIQSDGAGNYSSISAPSRAKLAPGAGLTLYYTGNTCSNSNMPLTSASPWCDPQQCVNYIQANLDIGNNKGAAGVVCQQLDSTVTASNNQGGGNASINIAGATPGQNTLIGITIQGNCVTPANTVLHPTQGSIIGADDYAGLAIGCMTVQVGSANAAVFVAQHHAFLSINDKVFISGGAQTGSAMQAQDRGHIIQFGTLTITGGTGAGSTASATVQSLVEVTGTLTLTNTTSASTYQATDGSVIVSSGVVYNSTGATITNKYVLANGGYLNTGGACGSVPGTGTSVDGFSNCH